MSGATTKKKKSNPKQQGAAPDPDHASKNKDTSSSSPSSSGSGTNDKKGVVKILKFLGVHVGFALFFFAGIHFGGGGYLKYKGYGTGSTDNWDKSEYTDAIQDFVDNHLLPGVKDTYDSLTEKVVGGGEATLRPGEMFKRRLLQKGEKETVGPKHPVLFVPGFITGGLQLWAGAPCLKHRFRESIWGGSSMATSFLADRECWIRHVALDPFTGMDPEDSSSAEGGGDGDGDNGNGDPIKVRAQQGFEAADYFISSYWIFGKLVQSLADVGYDPNTMDMMTYDWRMAYPLLEERDGFLRDFQRRVERMVEKNGGEKVVLIGHSMGNLMVLFFFRWVVEPEERGGGGAGRDWVERHVESFVNIGGPMLGVPKAVSALLSGEMKETAVLGKLGPLLEMYLGSKKRMNLINSWASVWNMLPKGGPALWEVGADFDSSSSEEGEEASSSPKRVLTPSPGKFHDTGDVCTAENSEDGSCTARISKSKEADAAIQEFARKNGTGTVDDLIQFMLDYGGGLGPRVAASRYHSFTSGGPASEGGESSPTLAQWHNPVATPLPHAPSMKVYCLYGVGVDTERGYAYKRNLDQDGKFLEPPFLIDTNYTDASRNIANGVFVADGDGSVPLLSLGYMCADGWVDNPKLNPSGVQIVTKEFPHEATFSMSDPLRAGPRAGEHCDILGNEELTFDILNIATGRGGTVDTRIVSKIRDIAEKVNSHELGGLDYVSRAEPKYRPGPVPSG